MGPHCSFTHFRLPFNFGLLSDGVSCFECVVDYSGDHKIHHHRTYRKLDCALRRLGTNLDFCVVFLLVFFYKFSVRFGPFILFLPFLVPVPKPFRY